MSSVKEIKQRIKNVSNTRQIMKAMDMVSTSKLQKARERVENARPLYLETKRMVEQLRYCEAARDNIFVKPRKVKKSAYVVIASDKGLCGSYNNNILNKALAHMDEGKNEALLLVGAKAYDFFHRRNKNIIYHLFNETETQIYFDAGHMSEFVRSIYTAGEVDEVFLAYTRFESTLSYVPVVERVLPLADGNEKLRDDIGMTFEPDVHAFLEGAVPLYLHACFFAAMSESLACEHAARMVNMDSANKNASDVIDKLTRQYNRKRQAAITQELTEIVGGANITK